MESVFNIHPNNIKILPIINNNQYSFLNNIFDINIQPYYDLLNSIENFKIKNIYHFLYLRSILIDRKFKNSPIIADNKHLHQLLFFFIKEKFIKKNLFSNNISSILINSYNLIIMLVSSINIYSSNFQTFLIVTNVLIYFIVYKYLFIYRFEKK